MKKIIHTFLLLFSLALSSKVFSQVFYDNSGKPQLFYVSSNNTLFDYSGNPKFYFKFETSKKIHLYDFSGKHIAWLVEGVLRDHEGRILASQNGRIINITYSIEPVRPVQKIIPVKSVEQIPPIQPINKNEFSTSSLLGVSDQTQNTSGYLQNDYTSKANFRPYELPADDIYNALKSLNDQHNRLIAQGYIYDARTDKYYTKEQFAPIEASRRAVSKSYYEMVNEAKSTNAASINYKKPKKKSLYWAYIGNPEFGVHSAKVLIKKSGKIRGFYFTHPQYGYMFFGVYGKPKVGLPSQDVRYIGDISKFRRKEVGLLGSAFTEGVVTIFYQRGLTVASK